MPGLFDGLNGGGLLPFDQRFGDWMPIPPSQAATMRSGVNGWMPAPPPQLPPFFHSQQPVGQNTALAFNGDTQGAGIMPPQLGAPAAQTPSQTPNSGGSFLGSIGDRIAANPLTLMALGSGIYRGGLGRGFAEAAPVASQERQFNLQQQALGATYDALRKSGVPEAQARAFALNPQLMANILRERQFGEMQRHNLATEQQAATAPVKIGTDEYGGDLFAVRDPTAPSGFRRLSAGENAAASSAAAALHGDEYLAGKPAERAQLIRGVANYDINPQSLSIKGGHRERILGEALQFRPDYDQRNYAASQSALKTFNEKRGDSVRSFNVALDHLDQIGKLGDALENGDVHLINSAKNAFKTAFGYEAPTNFQALKAIVGQEVVKAIVANGGGEREREEAGRTLSAANSPGQLAGVINTAYKPAMAAQLAGLKRQYEQGTLRNDFDRLLSENAKAEMKKHGAEPAPVAGAAPGAAAPASGPPGAPEVGTMKGGYRFKGGNPADKANWELAT